MKTFEVIKEEVFEHIWDVPRTMSELKEFMKTSGIEISQKDLEKSLYQLCHEYKIARHGENETYRRLSAPKGRNCRFH